MAESKEYKPAEYPSTDDIIICDRCGKEFTKSIPQCPRCGYTHRED